MDQNSRHPYSKQGFLRPVSHITLLTVQEGKPEEISTISATLNKRFRNRAHITRYTSEYLEDKYKRPYNTRESYGNATRDERIKTFSYRSEK